MNVAKLIEVLDYIIEVIEQKQIVTKYQQLINLLNQVRQNPTPQLTERLQKIKEDIYNINEDIEPKNWNYSKLKLYEVYNQKGIIGYKAIERITKSFQNNQANPAGVAQEIQLIVNEINVLKKNITIVTQTLEPIIEEYTPEEVPEEKTIFYLFFENQVEIRTIKELEKASNEWNKILRSFARLAKDSTATPEIYSIDKGSLILGLLAGISTIVAIAKGISEVLEVYKKVLEIRKLQLETKKLKLGIEVEQKFEERIDELIQKSADRAVEKLLSEFGEETADLHEIKNGVTISLKKMFNFIEKGGKIDYEDVNMTKETKNARRKLNRAFQKVKEIESNINEMKKLMSKN